MIQQEQPAPSSPAACPVLVSPFPSGSISSPVQAGQRPKLLPGRFCSLVVLVEGFLGSGAVLGNPELLMAQNSQGNRITERPELEGPHEDHRVQHGRTPKFRPYS